MAAALAIEAHGRALRLAAKVGGVHHQGLAALAGHLRRRGCSDRRLLRRLSALDAAVGIIRHITVVSVQELEKDLHAELVKMEEKAEVPEVFAEEEPQGVQTEPAAEVDQLGAQPVVHLETQNGVPEIEHIDGSQVEKLDKVQLEEQQDATKLGEPEHQQQDAQLDKVGPQAVFVELPLRLGGRGPNPPLREGGKRARHPPAVHPLQVATKKHRKCPTG